MSTECRPDRPDRDLMPEQKRMMGIDFGQKRVGIAVSDPTGIIARGLDTIPNDRNLIETVIAMIVKLSVGKVVVGKPLMLSGKEGVSAIEAAKFAAKLREKLRSGPDGEIEVVEWDERFTTTMAQRIQLELGVKRKERQRKSNLDRMASQLILQSYLDSRK